MVEVSCLCAAWCGTCTEYRLGFLARDGQVLFHGTLLPIHAHLERLLEELVPKPGK